MNQIKRETENVGVGGSERIPEYSSMDTNVWDSKKTNEPQNKERHYSGIPFRENAQSSSPMGVVNRSWVV